MKVSLIFRRHVATLLVLCEKEAVLSLTVLMLAIRHFFSKPVAGGVINFERMSVLSKRLLLQRELSRAGVLLIATTSNKFICFEMLRELDRRVRKEQFINSQLGSSHFGMFLLLQGKTFQT